MCMAGGRTKTSGQGRPKGVPNKVTTELKGIILGALEAEGGIEYMRWAAREHAPAFLQLVGKILPTQLAAAEGGGLTIFQWQDAQPPLAE